jgi:hypothetical protein
MDKHDQQRALAMSHDPTNSDRSFHELRLAVDAGREAFTAADVRSLLACIDGLDAELMAATHEEQAAKFERRAAVAETARLRTALEKIDAIRNDIIGRQSVNWSRHIYPLVTALGEAGFEGAGYEIAREKAKQEIDWLRANPDRAAAYALVERETREAGLSIMVGPCNAIESFGAVSDQQEIGTLLEAVDKLRGDGRGENENG